MLGGMLPDNKVTKIVLWLFVIGGSILVIWLVSSSLVSQGVPLSPTAET